jgi:hypothetical protein
MSHSQKYCPLRQCKLCRTYGHSEIVCHKLQPHAQKSNTRGLFTRGPESGAGLPPGFSADTSFSSRGGVGARASDSDGITFKVTAEDEDAGAEMEHELNEE